MSKIKDSEQMLHFLNDLSKFTQTFSTLNMEQPKKEDAPKSPPPPPPKKENTEEKKENPQSPTEGIADAFIQNILDSYLKKN